jgi:hypothetical protein
MKCDHQGGGKQDDHDLVSGRGDPGVFVICDDAFCDHGWVCCDLESSTSLAIRPFGRLTCSLSSVEG